MSKQPRAPLHEADLRTQALAAFGQSRQGARISEQLDAGFEVLPHRAATESDGASGRLTSGAVRPRTRAGMGIPPERIPSWEYEAAVVQVLSACGALPEEALVGAVRDGLGYGAASAMLRGGVHAAIDRLSASGRLGIGGSGIAIVGSAGWDA